MEKKIEEMRKGNEVAVNANESVKFINLCVSSGVQPHCQGCVNVLGNVIVYFTA